MVGGVRSFPSFPCPYASASEQFLQIGCTDQTHEEERRREPRLKRQVWNKMQFRATDAAHPVGVEIGLTKDADELGPEIDFRNLRASPRVNADKTVVITPRPDASREEHRTYSLPSVSD